jgi:hypothetical protein
MKVLPYLNPYKSIIYLEFFEQGKVYFKPWQIWINLKILNKSEKYCSLRAEPKASRPITTMKLDHLYFLLPHAARPGAAVPGSCRHPLLHAPVPPPSPPPRGRNTKPHPPSPPPTHHSFFSCRRVLLRHVRPLTPLFNYPSQEPIVRHELPTSKNLFPRVLLVGSRCSTSSDFAKPAMPLMPFSELHLPRSSAHFSTAFSPPSNPQSYRYCPRPPPATAWGTSLTNTAALSPSSTPHRHCNTSVSPRPAPVARHDALGLFKLVPKPCFSVVTVEPPPATPPHVAGAWWPRTTRASCVLHRCHGLASAVEPSQSARPRAKKTPAHHYLLVF